MPDEPTHLNVKLRPEVATMIHKALDSSPLPGVEAKRHAAEAQEAIEVAGREYHEAAQAAAE